MKKIPQKEIKEGQQNECPVFLALSLIANKWSISILYNLLNANNKMLRFGELKKLLGNITQRELTKQLREFEKSGIVVRKIYPEVPPRVEYTLTKLGQSLCQPIEALSSWSEKYGKEVQKNRKRFKNED